jgi:tagatose-1,6-bisphosphate aldolase non-catalytic subunit AgaZ/GatZ
VTEEGQAPDALARHHEKTRRRGVNTLVYWVVRAVVQPAVHLWFRLSRTGHRNVP